MAHHFKIRISVEIRVSKIVNKLNLWINISPSHLSVFSKQKCENFLTEITSSYTSTQIQVHLNSNPFQSILTNTKTSFTISLVK